MTALTDSRIFCEGNASNVATDVAMSGDATIDHPARPSCIMRVPFQDYFLALFRKAGLLAGKPAQSSVPSSAVPPSSLWVANSRG
jgi:hypothetical protein